MDILDALTASESEVADFFTSLSSEELALRVGTSGIFIPASVDLAPVSIERRRDDLAERWRRRNLRLRSALASWSEQQLDTIRLPHPLLGKINAREMLYYTIYHAEHHIAATKRRLPRFAVDMHS